MTMRAKTRRKLVDAVNEGGAQRFSVVDDIDRLRLDIAGFGKIVGLQCREARGMTAVGNNQNLSVHAHSFAFCPGNPLRLEG